MAEVERQFKIKVGTLRRVMKDLSYYVQEHATQARKVEQMRADGRDEYDVRKQEEVLLETETMLPDCQSRLREAARDVEAVIKANRAQLEALEVFQQAQALLDQVPALL